MHHSDDRPSEAAALLFLPVLLGGLVVFAVSRQIGASFATTLWAIFGLGLAGVIAFGAFWFTRLLALTVGGYLTIGWISVWPVLNSIGCGGCDPDTQSAMPSFPYADESVWSNGYLHWGVLLALIAATILLCAYERDR